jgi:hypothetical protein
MNMKESKVVRLLVYFLIAILNGKHFNLDLCAIRSLVVLSEKGWIREQPPKDRLIVSVEFGDIESDPVKCIKENGRALVSSGR